jgi:hypothetical protein
VYVAQAFLMQRLRGGGESRGPVRDELRAEGVELGIDVQELCRIIADVRACLGRARGTSQAEDS